MEWTLSRFLRLPLIEHHKVGGVIIQKCFLSRFWRLQVGQQVVRRAASFLKVLGENTSLLFPAPVGSPWHSLACSRLIPISASVFLWPSSLCVSESKSPSSLSYEDISAWTKGSSSSGRTSSELTTLLRCYFQTQSHSQLCVYVGGGAGCRLGLKSIFVPACSVDQLCPTLCNPCSLGL